MNLPERSHSVGIGILVCAIAFAACAPLPSRDARPEIKPIGRYGSDQSFAAPAGHWPADSWWTAYGDHQLDTLIDEALAGSPTIAVAQARLQRAQASVQVAGSANQPQLNANPSVTEQKQSYNYLTPRGVTPQGWNDYGRATLTSRGSSTSGARTAQRSPPQPRKRMPRVPTQPRRGSRYRPRSRRPTPSSLASTLRWIQRRLRSRFVPRLPSCFYPNVNLAAFIGVQSLGLDMLTNSGSSIGSVGPAISLPIFNGGRLQGQLRGADADYAEAVANYDRTVVQALQDVADAAVSQKALGGQIVKTGEAVDAAREAWRIQNNRYTGGLSTYLDVLSAEDSLLSNLRVQTDLQSRSFTLDVALVRALGGGYSTNNH